MYIFIFVILKHSVCKCIQSILRFILVTCYGIRSVHVVCRHVLASNSVICNIQYTIYTRPLAKYAHCLAIQMYTATRAEQSNLATNLDTCTCTGIMCALFYHMQPQLKSDLMWFIHILQAGEHAHVDMMYIVVPLCRQQ